MTIATETLTLRLPVQAVNRLRRVAALAHRPIDEVVADTLQSTLPPVLDDLPLALQSELAVLESWSNEALRRQVFAKLDVMSNTRYDELLDRQATATLSEQEQTELEALRATADLLMFRKAYAALILKWCGQRVPSVAELEASN